MLHHESRQLPTAFAAGTARVLGGRLARGKLADTVTMCVQWVLQGGQQSGETCADSGLRCREECVRVHAKSRFRQANLSAVETAVRHQADAGTSSARPGRRMSRGASVTLTTLILVVGALLVLVFLHFDRHDQISNVIRGWGALGVLAAIGLMALFCVIPVPSEFLMIMNMKIYGVWWGILYTWIGAMAGAVAVFLIARYLGTRLLHAFISEDRFLKVNEWVQKRGAFGLLLARLVPLPFIVVNYTAGVLHSVKMRDYIWTTGVGLLPYDLGAALVFLGISKRFMVWGLIGGVAVLAIWGAGYLFNRRAGRNTASRAH